MSAMSELPTQPDVTFHCKFKSGLTEGESRSTLHCLKEMDGDVPKLRRLLIGVSVHRNCVAAVYLVKRNVKGQAALDSGEAT